MKQPIYYLILFCLCIFQFELLGQLDQCKGLPPYFLKKGINPQKAYLSTSEKFLVGMALIESEQPGNPNAKIIKVTGQIKVFLVPFALTNLEIHMCSLLLK